MITERINKKTSVQLVLRSEGLFCFYVRLRRLLALRLMQAWR